MAAAAARDYFFDIGALIFPLYTRPKTNTSPYVKGYVNYNV